MALVVPGRSPEGFQSFVSHGPMGKEKDNYAVAVTRLADNKLLVAGNTEGNFTLARLHPKGLRDLSFGGGDGKVITDFGGTDSASALVVRQGGRPVVVGTTTATLSGMSGSALAAYASDGSPDPRFGGGDGKVQARFSYNCSAGGGAYVSDAVKRANDKIVVAGSGCVDDYYGGEFFTLERRLPTTGALDKTFGSGGSVTTSFVRYRGAEAYAADSGTPGKLVVGGRVIQFDPELEDFVGSPALARYLLN